MKSYITYIQYGRITHEFDWLNILTPNSYSSKFIMNRSLQKAVSEAHASQFMKKGFSCC